MTTSYTANMLDWLRDAHAMEEQAEQLFSGQAKRFKDYPSLAQQFEVESANVRTHQRALSIRIQQLGGEISVVKDTAGKIMAAGQNFMGMLMTDEPVKGILALYTFTHMGIASYLILIAAAEGTQDEETRNLCKSILEHHRARAEWLEKHLGTITEQYLVRAAA